MLGRLKMTTLWMNARKMFERSDWNIPGHCFVKMESLICEGEDESGEEGHRSENEDTRWEVATACDGENIDLPLEHSSTFLRRI